MNRIISLLIYASLLFPLTSNVTSHKAYAEEADPQVEPVGFRDMKWGEVLGAASNTVYSRTDSTYGDVDIFTKHHENLKIGKATANKIEYRFYEGRFEGMEIQFCGIENLRELMKYYGQELKEFDLINQPLIDFLWPGITTVGYVRFELSTQCGTAYLFSVAVDEAKTQTLNKRDGF